MQSLAVLYILPVIIINILLPDALASSSTSEVLALECSNKVLQNSSMFVPNFVSALENVAGQVQTSGFAVAVTGSGPDKPDETFALAQCYANVSSSDCLLCYAEARTNIPMCFPSKGGRVFVGSCFLRYDNYSFLQEFSRAEDKVVCGNGTRKNLEFRQAMEKGLSDAIKNKGYTKVQLPAYGNSNDSVYILSDCWRPLSNQSCSACLKNASASLLSCLPSSEGFALFTGCIMRYAGADFLNSKLENRSSTGPGNSSSTGPGKNRSRGIKN